MKVAYWISPKGHLVPLQQNHIQSVVSYPTKFGYTKLRVARIYKKYDEKIAIEGSAREEIIRDLVSKGWIRVRRYSSKAAQRWSITANRLDNRTKVILHRWASKILKAGVDDFKEKDRYIPLKIELLAEQRTADDLTVSDIACRKWLDGIDSKKYPFKIATCFEDLPDL
ncbi:hypothetical protein ACFL1G_09770 [Planctomycetota bacterium]